MIVCHCFKVRSETLIALCETSDTIEDLRSKTTAGRGCGGCLSHIKELFEEHSKKDNSQCESLLNV